MLDRRITRAGVRFEDNKEISKVSSPRLGQYCLTPTQARVVRALLDAFLNSQTPPLHLLKAEDAHTACRHTDGWGNHIQPHQRRHPHRRGCRSWRRIRFCFHLPHLLGAQ